MDTDGIYQAMLAYTTLLVPAVKPPLVRIGMTIGYARIHSRSTCPVFY